MRLLILAIFLLPAAAFAKNQTFVGEFTHSCMTVEGDTLDPNGDGVCEELTGFRVYTEAGEFVYGMPETGVRTWEFIYNAPTWTIQCFKMTAVIENPADPTDVIESDFSNTGACAEIRPGKPVAPVLGD